MSDFAEAALNEKAQAVMAREEKIVLSQRDWDRFVAAIENSELPNDRLRAVAEHYKAVRREQPELNW